MHSGLEGTPVSKPDTVVCIEKTDTSRPLSYVMYRLINESGSASLTVDGAFNEAR